MKVRFYRWYNALLTSLLALMGYGCSSDEPMDMYGTIVAMYGALVIKYSVKGNVTDEDGNPIKNIKASVKTGPYGEEGTLYYPIDSTLTDVDGKFTMDNLYDYMAYNQKLIVEDIDGEENGGEFQSDTLSIDQLDAKQIEPSSGTWDAGKYELTANIRLKKKEQ